jgi:hypothetical protein
VNRIIGLGLWLPRVSVVGFCRGIPLNRICTNFSGPHRVRLLLLCLIWRASLVYYRVELDQVELVIRMSSTPGPI